MSRLVGYGDFGDKIPAPISFNARAEKLIQLLDHSPIPLSLSASSSSCLVMI
jgi:hypothetical protein